MTIQLSLIEDTTIKKTIKNISIEQLALSEFNPRYSREDDQINKLAIRIGKNGFEITRALWVYQNGQGYKVFAGGTRLEAARRAGCKSIPCVIHEGLEEADIVRLADEDNENDEYHNKVSPVDVWAHYAYLDNLGWQQQEIARAKGVSKSLVSERIKWNLLPDKLKKEVLTENVTEGHLREVCTLVLTLELESWLAIDQAQLELISHSAKQKLTVRQTSEQVAKLKEVIKLAQDYYSQLAPDWQPAFVESLAKTKARSKAEVQTTYNGIVNQMTREARRKEEELAQQQSQAEAERIRLEREQERNAKIEAILANIHQGDFREVCKQIANDSVDVIITDPPYPEEYLSLFEPLAQEAARILKPGGSMLVMCGQSYLPQIFVSMSPHLNYHWTLSYLTPGGQSPQIWQRKINTFWKPVLWFVKGEYQGDWHGDVIKSDVNDNDKRFHNWGQSESGMRRLVENFSQPDEIILDPFCGGGTTGLVAIEVGRTFIGIDTDEESIRATKERIFGLLQEQE